MPDIQMKQQGGVWRAVGQFARGLALKSMRWSGYGGGTYGSASGGGNQRYGDLLRRLLPGASFDYEAQAGPLHKNAVVAIALEWIRKNGPEPRLTVETRKKNEWEDNPEHPLLAWIEEPNDDYDDDTLQSSTDLSLIVDGNAYWRREAGPSGREWFWYIPHTQVKPAWPDDGSQFISHYVYTVDGKTIDIPKKEMIHFRTGLDPDNERVGMSPLKACLREVCSDNEASTYTAAILRNMGVPGVIISPENATDDIDQKEATSLKSRWRRLFTSEGRGEPMVNSVNLRIQEIGLSPEKLALDKIRKIPEARIAAAIGVPAQTLGLTVGDGTKTYANQGAANRQAYLDCIMPLQKTKAKQLQRALRKPLTGSKPIIGPRRIARLCWEYSDVQALREDQTEVSKRVVVEYQGGIITQNEARNAIHKPPTPDGDKFLAKPTMTSAIPVVGDNREEGIQK